MPQSRVESTHVKPVSGPASLRRHRPSDFSNGTEAFDSVSWPLHCTPVGLDNFMSDHAHVKTREKQRVAYTECPSHNYRGQST